MQDWRAINTYFEIDRLFEDLGVYSDSVAMIHGDAGALLSIVNKREDVSACVDAILDYFGETGTAIIPTFTYSATKSECYVVESTPGSIGRFSEMFRTNPRMKRTKHPNFSVCVAGSESKNILEARIDDAFGKGTIFDFLYGANASLVTIGCSINALTYTHYVEQQVQVFYRYLKSFKAEIKSAEYLERIETTYYVRNLDLDFDTTIDLTKKFQNRAIESGHLRVSKFGRFQATAIRARDCFDVMRQMLSENQLALVRGYNAISPRGFDS